MKCNTEVKTSSLKSIAQLLLSGLVWGLIVANGLIIFGCDNEADRDSDEYYVKYEVNSSTIYFGGKLNVTINSENNDPMTIIVNQSTLWETIVGPVDKGFQASLNVKAFGNTNNQLKLFTNIYVSKNNSPFALKKSDVSNTPRDQVQISYTIDY